MTRFMKYSFLVALACMSLLTAQARNINVDVNTIRGDLTRELRGIGERADINDTVILNFPKGNFTIDGTIQFWCNVVIKGAGRNKTTIIMDQGKDRDGFQAFKDDSFINILGSLEHPISASISNLSIKLKEHQGIWWTDGERYAVKIYHSNHVDINNVDSYMANANITNFDMRVCSNVTVTNCNITNYNNSEIGGCLWVRGEAHNIVITHNKFYKYGKDEVLAFYSRLVNANGYVRGSVSRSDITVSDNDFYYGGYPDKDKNTSSINSMIVSLFTDNKKSADRCTTSNFRLTNNSFHIDDVCTRCIYISFDPADTHNGIYIQNNIITNSALNVSKKYYRQDIEVNDLSDSKDVIHIVDNSITNYDVSGSGSSYSFLLMQGGNVEMLNNKIVNKATVNPSDGKIAGVQLVWCGANGGTVTMTNNVCKGIKFISTVGAGDGAKSFTLNASNNYFSGDTRIYCNKIEQLNLNFTNNTFVSHDMNFFLQEFASRGTLIFNNNQVTVNTGGGRLMTHWDNTSLDSKRFDKLEVKNNIFKGVKSEQDLLKHITNTGKRSIKGNSIRP